MKFLKKLPQDVNFVTDPETGKKYPIPAGGSGMDAGTGEVEQALQAADGSQQEEEPETSSLEEEEDDDEDEEVENLNGEAFLNSIEDEELRKQLEPHVKRWDAGVTRRFQELHSQLKPFKELGEYEQLAEAAQLYQILNERPEDLYRALAQSLGDAVQQGQPGTQSQTSPQQQQQQQQQQGQNGGLTQQQYAQLPPDVQKRIDQQEKIVTTLAEHFLEDRRTQQQQEEDQQLDNYLSNLRSEFGDFDEEYVLSKMANGVDGAKAVKQYHKTIEKELAKKNSQSAPTGILGGGGQVGQQTVDVGNLGDKDVKSLVAGLMAQAQGE